MQNASDVAISVKSVSKAFRVHLERNRTLKDKILYWGRERYREFTALQEVSLDVARGSTVGLVGVNGSGKSTLLKIMSRILYPDSGSVEVKGRVSSLLELGAGFHPDFTGRENIFMNGAMLSLSKREINAKLDEIIEFSELGDFIDEPVRSFSSGMYMRLAFSVAVAVDPEILLIDEILAVGDAAFQAKCMGRIRQLQSQGKTVVIVTHDTGAVEKFCDTVVWLHRSTVRMHGDPTECIQSYLTEVFRSSHEGESVMSFDRVNRIDSVKVPSQENGLDHSPGMNSSRWGSHEIEITDIDVLSDIGEGLVRSGQPLEIAVKYHSSQEVVDVVFGVEFITEEGVQCYGTNTYIDGYGVIQVDVGVGTATFKSAAFPLLPGKYLINVSIQTLYGSYIDYYRHAARLTIFSDREDVGICRIEHHWKIDLRN